MQAIQQVTTETTHQESVQQQKPSIKAKQKPIQSKQGRKPRHKAKQQPLQRNHKRAIKKSNKLDEVQIKENVSQLMGTDVADAQVHYNSNKPAQLQAEATAQGTEVHLAPGKEQHLGHELTHVAQQKQGRVQPTIQANNGVGINNDPKLEKEADEVGEKAMKGELSISKTNTTQISSVSHHVAPVQRYVEYSKKHQVVHLSEDETKVVNPQQKEYTEKERTNYEDEKNKNDKKYKKEAKTKKIKKRTQKLKERWRHPQRKKLFVSNDGKMAVEGKKTKSTQAWATQGLIDEANKVLEKIESYVKLKADTNDLVVGSIPGQTTDNPNKGSFKKVIPIKSHNSKPLTEKGNTKEERIKVFKGRSRQMNKLVKLRDCGNANKLIMGAIREGEIMAKRVYKDKNGSISIQTEDPNQTIGKFIKLVFVKEYSKSYSLKEALEVYRKLEPDEKKRLDKKYGLDAGAKPSLGQGVTTVATDHDSDDGGYNFHFATNIMESGGDYMALEGLADHEVWYFSLYGSQKGQSFHERQEDVVQKPHVSAIVDRKPRKKK